MREFADFFATTAPYDAWPAEDREQLVRALEVEYVPRGTWLLPPGAPTPHHTWVVRAGALEVMADGGIVDTLGAGDTVDAGQGAVRTADDSLLYRIPGRPAPAASAATSALRAIAPVAGLARPLVVVPGDEPVASVAARMGRERTSCVVVDLGRSAAERWGVVTDADVRRLVGTGEVRVADRVERLASRPALTVDASTAAAPALLTMVEHGVHHLVVVDAAGEPCGVLRAVDLAAAEVRDPLAIRAVIEAAGTPEEVGTDVAGFAATAAGLADAGVPPMRVAGLLTALHEAVIRRVLALGGHLEPAGEAVGLVALGSLARREMLPSSDLDTALVWADGPPGEQVRGASARLLDDLERVGLRRCPDGANADDPRFARSVGEWRGAAAAWRRDPVRDAGLLLLTMLAASRPLTHPELLAAVRAQLPALRRDVAFRRTVLEYTLAARPPVGFVRGVVVEHSGEHRGRLDLKRGALRPVTAIARWVAVSDDAATGATTPELLRAGVGLGLLTGDEAESLVHAYEQCFALALTAELAAVRSGGRASTWIDPGSLDSLTRRQLREAFRAVARVQDHLESSWAPRWR